MTCRGSALGRAVATVTFTVSAAFAGCGYDGGTPAAAGNPGPDSPSAHGRITVFAAASLRAPLTELAETFEQANPGSDVTFSFAGSSELAAQILGGAPADVFASADTANMTKVVDASLVAGRPADFATNTLTIVVPPPNPAGITSFADLAGSGVDEVICAPQVPCGSATKKIEAVTGVVLSPVSEESSVTDVLSKVITGEAEAGLVYLTDARAAGTRVRAVPFSESGSAVNTYQIVVLETSEAPELASRFTEWVTGPGGRRILSAAGFAPPP